MNTTQQSRVRRTPIQSLLAASIDPLSQTPTESNVSLTMRSRFSMFSIPPAKKSTLPCESNTCGQAKVSCSFTPSRPARVSKRSQLSSNKSCESRTRTTSPWSLWETSAIWRVNEKLPGRVCRLTPSHIFLNCLRAARMFANGPSQRVRTWRGHSAASLSRHQRSLGSTSTRHSTISSAKSDASTAKCKDTRPAVAPLHQTAPSSQWMSVITMPKRDAAPSA